MTRRQTWCFLFLLLFGIISVVSTYTGLSETDDELFHVSCGMEWWTKGTYLKQPLHPPLARIMDASLLYFVESMASDGRAWANVPPRDAYIDRLVLTRLGTLPFYIFSCIVVFWWSRNLFGTDAALFSLASYVTLSSVTAHGALATTDMGYTAMLLWALLMGVEWLKAPDRKRSLLLGLSTGLMTGTKFSALVHWPAAMAAILAAQAWSNHRQSRPLLSLEKIHLIHAARYALPVFLLVLALLYGFSFKPLLDGIKSATLLSKNGYSVWLYGPLKNHGVWYFFPVVFFFKTPLSLFAASIIGNTAATQETRRNPQRIDALFPLAAAIAIMLVSMTSNINLGVRHVLPLYPLLAIPAGYGLLRLWQGELWKRAAAVGFLLWQLAGFVDAAPEHLAYFNVLAGDHPEHITLDSDFDWGQAMILLDETLQQHDVRTAYLCVRRDAVWNAATVAHIKLSECPKGPVTGWIAVSRAFRQTMPDNFAWLGEREAVQSVGRTMDLYYIPPP